MSDAREIVWQMCSGTHDWQDGAYVRRVVRTLADRHLIGPIEWALVGYDERPAAVPDEGEIADVLLGLLEWDDDCADLTIGGSEPHPWSIFIYLNALDPDTNFPVAANTFELELEPAAFEDIGGSAGLRSLFRELHSPEDTEVATLHSKALRARIMDREERFSYLLISPLWATFLGPGHLRLVDRERLDASTADIEWVDDRGVFILMRDGIETLDQEDVDERRRDLVARLWSAWVEGS